MRDTPLCGLRRARPAALVANEGRRITGDPHTGQAIVAISTEAFCDVEPFKPNVDALIRSLRGSRRLPGVDRNWRRSSRAAQPAHSTTNVAFMFGCSVQM